MNKHLFILFLGLSLVGCGGSDDNSSPVEPELPPQLEPLYEVYERELGLSVDEFNTLCVTWKDYSDVGCYLTDNEYGESVVELMISHDDVDSGPVVSLIIENGLYTTDIYPDRYPSETIFEGIVSQHENEAPQNWMLDSQVNAQVMYEAYLDNEDVEFWFRANNGEEFDRYPVLDDTDNSTGQLPVVMHSVLGQIQPK
ncbi:hypothetical protein [Vibrio bathopelagicus]